MRLKRILVAVSALVAFGAGAAAHAEVKPADWAAYGRDAGGARFSPLTQITPANVGALRPAWTYHMNTGQAAYKPFSTATPLVVDGRMYLGVPYGRVVALDAATGEEIWTYQLPARDQPAARGLSYWPGDRSHAPRILVATQRGALIALEAGDGRPSAGFGREGVVDTKTAEVMNGFPEGAYGYSAPPMIYRNLAILGSRVQEAPTKGPSGDVRAWDILTGKLVWTFHAVPRPGERFHDTWEGESWIQRSGVNMWNMGTVDEARGIAYLAFAAPAFDRYGGDRKGDNLFANSIVAVDAATGKYLWHFQTVHHDIWDYDMTAPPTLLTVVKDGRRIPAVAAINKSALLFLLDRVTGKPIFGVTEKPVPRSSVSSEAASPTQPFPNKPGVITRMSFDLSDLADVTPEHRAVCQKLVEQNQLVGSQMYEPLREDRTMVRFPGGAGGAEWGGGAFDPQRGLFIFANNQLGYMERLTRGEDGSWTVNWVRFWDPKTHRPCQAPPWGELIAVDVNKGEVAWRTTLGVTEEFPEGKQNTGRVGNAGPITTASGLTFIGGVDDRRFRAFDTRTGKELWSAKLDYAAHATPITYQGRDGRQYVAVIATGGSYLGTPSGGDGLYVFALPPAAEGAVRPVQ